MVLKGRVHTPEELLQHVIELAAAFNITLLQEGHNMLAERAAGVHLYDKKTKQLVQKQIIAKPVHDEATYAIALHEMGHCEHPTGIIHGETERFDSLQEESAWEWAEHYALCWTVTMEMVKQQGLESHRRHQAHLKRAAEERKRETQKFLKRIKI